MSSEKFPVNGTCLCGVVKIEINLPEKIFNACHCGMCRKWTSGPLFTVESKESAHIEGKESIATYSSSEWAERSFCKNCGTHLYYHLKNSNLYFYSAGLFKETSDFKFQAQIYIDAKPICYEFANKTVTMTEAEVMAKFMPS
jgi:hypothetical protein